MSIHTKLAEIQQKLVAQKGQRNDFGGYQYRSAEDIMHSVKPHLGHLTITCTDDLVELANRIYVKATVTISDGKESISVNAFAREPESVTKQAPAQTTGSSSSYARKYALSGLLLIDNEKDADVTNNHDGQDDKLRNDENINAINSASTHDALVKLYRALDVNTRMKLEPIFKARMQKLEKSA